MATCLSYFDKCPLDGLRRVLFQNMDLDHPLITISKKYEHTSNDRGNNSEKTAS